jgi:hypothetical protein
MSEWCFRLGCEEEENSVEKEDNVVSGIRYQQVSE